MPADAVLPAVAVSPVPLAVAVYWPRAVPLDSEAIPACKADSAACNALMAEMDQHADNEGIKRSEGREAAKKMNIRPPERQSKQNRDQAPKRSLAISRP